jgi:inner membrane protein
VLLLSSVAILSHPILDTLNTYGMRWLMPFSGRWFYGDTLFIVDPWLWLALGFGVMLSRPPRGSTRPARIALWLSFAYVVVMAVSTVAARRIAGPEIAAMSGEAVERLMVSPFPVNPFLRSVVAEQAEVYRTARFRWLAQRHLDAASVRIFPKGRTDHPAVQEAVATTVGRRYLGWARFPAFQVEPVGGGDFVVRIVDLRYGDPPGAPIGSVSIPVTIRPASVPSPDPLPPTSPATPAGPVIEPARASNRRAGDARVHMPGRSSVIPTPRARGGGIGPSASEAGCSHS